ncbi:hypothetical protein ABIC78_003777 [Novosphingobium sp. 1529]|uniref:hypothetical protein n=1 Tax=Novosphingobium sp. 1529 TaxID=3156424 RepID=UPI0033969CA7
MLIGTFWMLSLRRCAVTTISPGAPEVAAVVVCPGDDWPALSVFAGCAKAPLAGIAAEALPSKMVKSRLRVNISTPLIALCNLCCLQALVATAGAKMRGVAGASQCDGNELQLSARGS